MGSKDKKQSLCMFSTDVFLPNIFSLHLVEYTDTEPLEMKGWLVSMEMKDMYAMRTGPLGAVN